VTLSVSVRIEAEQEALLFGSGRITGVVVAEGDTVSEGSLLIGLSGDRAATGAVAASLGQLESATIAARNSANDWERCTDLYDAGAVSAADLQGAETAMIAAEAALRAARAGASGALSGQRASSVEAPFDGVVGRVWAREGALAGEEPLLMITGGDGCIARALLPERAAGWIAPGDVLLFTTSAVPGGRFEATVSSVAASIDPVTCLLPVTVRISDPDDLLSPGLYGILSWGRT